MDIEKKYTEILKLLKHRQDTLEAHSKLFKFIQKCDEFIDLLKDKRNIASSDDFGTDLEHVEVCIIYLKHLKHLILYYFIYKIF